MWRAALKIALIFLSKKKAYDKNQKKRSLKPFSNTHSALFWLK